MQFVGHVAELVRYPVKSMQGERLERVEVTAAGLDGDRTWAVRDTETGRIASAKQPRPWRALLDCGATVGDDGGVVTLPDGTALRGDDPQLSVTLGGLVDRPVELARASTSNLGTYDSEWPDIDGLVLNGEHELPMAMSTEAARFVDLAALHLMTTATLAHLRQLAPDATVDARRFRPNILIDTGDAGEGFLEDAWVGATVRIGQTLELTGVGPTPRCVMTTVEQPGLGRAPSVLRAMAEHNRRPFAGLGEFACTGVYAEVAVPGVIAPGDEVRVTHSA